MQKYELTERGKILICIILVILIFVIPSVIMAVKAWSNTTPPPDQPPQTVAPNPEDNVISDEPLPDGSGFDPIEPPETGNGEQGSYDPPEEPPEEQSEESPEPPAIGPISIDRTEGTMRFNFSPDRQDSLDADTIAMIGDFITSPRNTYDAQIVVEIPQLSARYVSTLKSAINDALAEHGIKADALSYTTYVADTTRQTYEIILSFIPLSNRK